MQVAQLHRIPQNISKLWLPSIAVSMWGKYLVSARTRNVVLVNRNIVKFYGSVIVTMRASLQNEIMAYLHFSELNSLQFQSQYNLFYMILLLLFMLCGPGIKPRKIKE